VVCNVLRVTPNTNPKQQEKIQETFIHPRFFGLSSQSVELQGYRLGDVLVVSDVEEFLQKHPTLNLIEVSSGVLTNETLSNIKLNIALRLFNCLGSSRVTSNPPSAELFERFEEMYRTYLQGGGKSNDVSFRALVRRLVRRVNGALANLFYLSASTDYDKGNVTKSLLQTLERYRNDQSHQTMGITPEVLRKMKKEVVKLSKILERSKHNYRVPQDPWAEFSKLGLILENVSSQYGIFPDRRGMKSLISFLSEDDAGASLSMDEEPGFVDLRANTNINNNSNNVGGRASMLNNSSSNDDYFNNNNHNNNNNNNNNNAENSASAYDYHDNSNASNSMRNASGSGSLPTYRLGNSTGMDLRQSLGVESEQLRQLKEASDVLESVVSKQREEIKQAQASYDALFEKYTAISTKMYESLQSLNTYKLRVDELEGQFKRLDHDWGYTSDTIKEYNDTFTNFEARVLRLDEHVNNMYRQSKGIFTRVGLFLLQLVVWFVGIVFGYGVSLVYLFRRKKPAEIVEKRKAIQEEVRSYLTGNHSLSKKEL
jgi:hypothetical protein